MATLIYDETRLFLVCLVVGGCLALVYDGIRILRLCITHKGFLIDLEDLAFWIFTAWIVFRTLFTYNRGALRAYAFLGLFLGVLIYVLTISRVIMFCFGKLLPIITKGKNLLKIPFISIDNLIRKVLKNMVTQVKMAIKGR